MLRGLFFALAISLVGCSLTIDFDKYARDGDRQAGTGGSGSGFCRADPQSTCDVCLSGKCCPQANACYDDCSCSNANDQNEVCLMHQSAGVCYAEFGNSGPLAGDLYRCLKDRCAQECSL
jgi:hypothetical protein